MQAARALRSAHRDHIPHDGVGHQRDEQALDEEPAFRRSVYLFYIAVRPPSVFVSASFR